MNPLCRHSEQNANFSKRAATATMIYDDLSIQNSPKLMGTTRQRWHTIDRHSVTAAAMAILVRRMHCNEIRQQITIFGNLRMADADCGILIACRTELINFHSDEGHLSNCNDLRILVHHKKEEIRAKSRPINFMSCGFMTSFMCILGVIISFQLSVVHDQTSK